MVKVLTIDDSVFMRTVIRDMLSKDPSIEVVGTASNGIDGLEKIQSLKPDVVTLDIEMPKMNGLDLLRELQKVRVRPKVLMLSSLTSKDAEATVEAIRLVLMISCSNQKIFPMSVTSAMNWWPKSSIS